jgi:hypothetical protein
MVRLVCPCRLLSDAVVGTRTREDIAAGVATTGRGHGVA